MFTASLFVVTVAIGFLVKFGGFTVVLQWVAWSGVSFTAVKAGGYAAMAQLTLASIFAVLQPHGPWMEMPGFTAHRIISFATMAYVCYVGGCAWLYPDAELLAASSSALTRLQHAHPVGEHLAQVLLGLNVVWDIPCGFLIRSLRERSNARLMLIHHLLVVLLAYLALLPRFQYYVVVFFGLMEASSAPLALMDLCHPRNVEWAAYARSHALVGAANNASRVVFGVSFLLTRALYFPFVMLSSVLPDLLTLLGMAAPPASKLGLAAILGSSLFLTGLQLHWAGLILRQAAGGAKPEHAKAA